MAYMYDNIDMNIMVINYYGYDDIDDDNNKV